MYLKIVYLKLRIFTQTRYRCDIFGFFHVFKYRPRKKGIIHDITILTIYIRSIFLYSLLKNVSYKGWMFLREIYSDINYVIT